MAESRFLKKVIKNAYVFPSLVRSTLLASGKDFKISVLVTSLLRPESVIVGEKRLEIFENSASGTFHKLRANSASVMPSMSSSVRSLAFGSRLYKIHSTAGY